jgi:hypothetical protein
MNKNKLIPLLLAFSLAVTSMACPTRPGDGDSSGSQGGSSRMDAGTGDAAGTTGTGGLGGASGTGGIAGATGTGGGAGAPGTGGSGETCNPSCATTTQTCAGTKCLLTDGQMCSIASQCASNTCTPFYLDQDGDGYGSGAAVGFCGTTAPVGYAAQNGDCCDDPSHLAVAKLIHPGAGYQTTSADGVCNVTWDYDCSGMIETNLYTCVACGTAPTCGCAEETQVDSSECGTAVGSASCAAESTGSCQFVSHGAGTLGCK